MGDFATSPLKNVWELWIKNESIFKSRGKSLPQRRTVSNFQTFTRKHEWFKTERWRGSHPGPKPQSAATRVARGYRPTPLQRRVQRPGGGAHINRFPHSWSLFSLFFLFLFSIFFSASGRLGPRHWLAFLLLWIEKEGIIKLIRMFIRIRLSRITHTRARARNLRAILRVSFLNQRVPTNCSTEVIQGRRNHTFLR